METVLILNGLLDYGLLALAGKLVGLKTSRRRLLLGASLGAVYGLFFVLGQAWLGHWAVEAVAAGLMLWLVGRGNSIPKIIWAYGYFYGLAGALAGIYRYLVGDWFAWWPRLGLLVTLLLLLGALQLSPYLQKRQFKQKIKLGLNGQEVKLTALLDSGNCLRDPRNGFPVLIVDYEAVKGILPATLQGWWDMDQNIPAESAEKIRLLPFRSLGQEQGIMPGWSADWLEMGNLKTTQIVVGISKTNLDQRGKYQALVNPENLREFNLKTSFGGDFKKSPPNPPKTLE